MNKPVYVNIILIYQFWYDNVNPKYSKKKQNYVIWIQIVSVFT